MLYIEKPKDFNPKFFVVTCYIEHEGKILLLKRNEKYSHPNKWCNPGGIVRGDAEESIIREIFAERSIKIIKKDLVFIKEVYIVLANHSFTHQMFKCKYN